jgi:ABC-type uncharacterized transport system substrate-binding protein
MKLRRILSGLFASSAVLWAQPSLAHPHVFVSTALHIVLDDQGQATGVEVRWAYDDLYSLLTFEDMGLDGDYDSKLTSTELARLDGFDLNWIAGFDGDLYVVGPAGPVLLGAPIGRGVAVENAQIITTHLRPFLSPVTAQGLVVQAYDPTYYTAYDLMGGVTVDGTCQTKVTPPDLTRAQQWLEELMAQQTNPDPDVFPEVGVAFADRVELSCAP